MLKNHSGKQHEKKIILINVFFLLSLAYAETKFDLSYSFGASTQSFVAAESDRTKSVELENNMNSFSSALGFNINFSDVVGIGTNFKSSASIIPFFQETYQNNSLFTALDVTFSLFNWNTMYRRQIFTVILAGYDYYEIFDDGDQLKPGETFEVSRVLDAFYFIDFVPVSGIKDGYFGKYSGKKPSMYLGVMRLTNIGIDEDTYEIDQIEEGWGGALHWDIRGIAEFKWNEANDSSGYIDVLHTRLCCAITDKALWMNYQIGMSYGNISDHFGFYCDLYIKGDTFYSLRSNVNTFSSMGPFGVAIEGKLAYKNYN